MTLSAKRRWSGGSQWYNRGLQYQAFYTYAQTKDDDSNERKFQDIFYQDWQNLGAEYTWSNNDIRHNFVMNATWAFAGDVQAGVIFNARSGSPYSRLSSTDLNGDGAANANDRQFINGVDTGRNSFRQPNYSRLDLRVSKNIRLRSAGASRWRSTCSTRSTPTTCSCPGRRATARRPATSCSRTIRTSACRTRSWALR